MSSLCEQRFPERFVLHPIANWRIINSQEATMTSGVIAEVLGGKKVLGRSIKSFAELAELIRKGLPAGSLVVLGEKLELKNAALSEKLGIPQRTLTRRLSQHSRLTAAESDRTVRLARVYATAVEMLSLIHISEPTRRTP